MGPCTAANQKEQKVNMPSMQILNPNNQSETVADTNHEAEV